MKLVIFLFLATVFIISARYLPGEEQGFFAINRGKGTLVDSSGSKFERITDVPKPGYLN